jgi:hypothetical protein
MRHHSPNKFLLVLLVMVLNVVFAGPPRTPFSGFYGATVGAGSLVGWDRLGGENPAVIGSGFGASASGYAPFGLEGLRVTEVEGFYDRAQFGLASGWRQLADEAGANTSRLRFQAVWRVSRALSAGGFLSADLDVQEAFGFGGGMGLLAHPHRFASVAIVWDNAPDVWGRTSRALVGVDAGTSLPPSVGPAAAWRMSAEYAHLFGVPSGVEQGEWRFGFGLRLHDMMGVYAGYAPLLQTMGLGVRFGLGGWVAHSAMRRHAALGGTAVHGVGWSTQGRSD